MYVRRRACGVIFGSGAIPRSARMSLTRLTTGARTRSRTRSFSRGRPLSVANTNSSDGRRPVSGPPDVQLIDQVEAQIDFADTGCRLALLDHEALVGCVDGPPPERADLTQPGAPTSPSPRLAAADRSADRTSPRDRRRRRPRAARRARRLRGTRALVDPPSAAVACLAPGCSRAAHARPRCRGRSPGARASC